MTHEEIQNGTKCFHKPYKINSTLSMHNDKKLLIIKYDYNKNLVFKLQKYTYIITVAYKCHWSSKLKYIWRQCRTSARVIFM